MVVNVLWMKHPIVNYNQDAFVHQIMVALFVELLSLPHLYLVILLIFVSAYCHYYTHR